MMHDWDNAQTIRASEIGEYVYCHRQWWLRRVEGIRPAATVRQQQGTVYHQQHWQLIRQAARNRKLSWVLAAAAFSVLLIALLLML